jgi:hypothetical protein
MADSVINSKRKWTKVPTPTWHDVIDTDNFESSPRTITDVYDLIKETGYQLFTWNSRIYELVDGTSYDTGWTVADLMKGETK